MVDLCIRNARLRLLAQDEIDAEGSLVERFLGSNHIRRRLRVCRTKCG